MPVPSRTVIGLALASAASCTPGPPAAPEPDAPPPPPAWDALLGDVSPDAEVYLAELRPLNVRPAGQAAAGRAAVVVQGDSVRIAVAAAGLATGEVHRPEVHGIEGLAHATCPVAVGGPGADGIVGPAEAEPFSGRLLFAFSPAATPELPDSGSWVSHVQTVSLPELEAGLRKVHDGIRRLDPERRVVYVQRLPRAAPGEAAAAHPFPVACGQLRPAGGG